MAPEMFYPLKFLCKLAATLTKAHLRDPVSRSSNEKDKDGGSEGREGGQPPAGWTPSKTEEVSYRKIIFKNRCLKVFEICRIVSDVCVVGGISINRPLSSQQMQNPTSKILIKFEQQQKKKP